MEKVRGVGRVGGPGKVYLSKLPTSRSAPRCHHWEKGRAKCRDADYSRAHCSAQACVVTIPAHSCIAVRAGRIHMCYSHCHNHALFMLKKHIRHIDDSEFDQGFCPKTQSIHTLVAAMPSCIPITCTPRPLIEISHELDVLHVRITVRIP